MSENRETSSARGAPIFAAWIWISNACLTAPSPTRDRAVRRAHLRRREDDRHLLPADLPGAHAEAREHDASTPPPRRRRRPGFGPACAAGPSPRPRPRRLARDRRNTVSRALALIEAGALDDGDVDALAARLGVGERQLRRLFQQHLGASPVAVAQTRRVLLAKQLIHETRLPMAEVALASGFGSVRRFNETFQQLCSSARRRSLRRSREDETPAPAASTSGCPTARPTTGTR